jgi:hypothetical protein
MTMNETEWKAIESLWRTADEAVDAKPLRRAVSVHRRWMFFAAVGEASFAVALVWLTWKVLREGAFGWRLVWAVSVWAFALAAFAFVWWNRRGTWTASGNSVADFIRLTRLRAKRQSLSLRFFLVFSIAETVVVVGQLVWFDRFSVFAGALLGMILAGMGVWYVVVRRRIARDLAIAAAYEEDLSGE